MHPASVETLRQLIKLHGWCTVADMVDEIHRKEAKQP